MPVKSRHFAYIKDRRGYIDQLGRKVEIMKKRMGKAGIALIFGALSAIFGFVIGQSLKDDTIDLTKLSKDNGYGKDNKPA